MTQGHFNLVAGADAYQRKKAGSDVTGVTND